MPRKKKIEEEIPQTPSQVIEPEQEAYSFPGGVLPEPTWIVDRPAAAAMFHSLETPQPYVVSAKLVEALPNFDHTVWVLQRMQRYLVREGSVLYVPSNLADLPLFEKRHKQIVGDYTAIF